MRQLIIFILLISFNINSSGQNDSCWSVLIHKANKFEYRSDMRTFNNSGFFLYKNCIYDFKLRNGNIYSGRLTDIKSDSLFFTNFPTYNISIKSNSHLDTFGIHFTQLEKIFLIKDWSSEARKTINLDNYNFVFVKDTLNNIIESKWGKVFSEQLTDNELIPRLSYPGITYHYDFNGKLYYHSGIKPLGPNVIQRHLRYDPVRDIWYFYLKEIEN